MASITMNVDQVASAIGKSVEDEIKKKILDHLFKQVTPELERIAKEAAKSVAVRMVSYSRHPNPLMNNEVIELAIKFGDGEIQRETIR